MTHDAKEVPTVKLTAELTQQQAWDLAQFLKRTTFSDVLRNTVGNDEDEAYAMLAGIRVIEKALDEAGIAPR